MTEESFLVELAGRRWAIPHLPFRLVKAIQPALFKIYSETAQAADAAMTEAQVEGLAMATWRAVSYVAPEITFEAFQDLPFSVADLLAALPSVALAAGLRTKEATAEASPEPGKSISTP